MPYDVNRSCFSLCIFHWRWPLKQSAISAITHNQSERTISFGVTADEDDEKKGIGGGDHPHTPLRQRQTAGPYSASFDEIAVMSPNASRSILACGRHAQ